MDSIQFLSQFSAHEAVFVCNLENYIYELMEFLSWVYSCYVHNPDISDHPNYMSRILVALSSIILWPTRYLVTL